MANEFIDTNIVFDALYSSRPLYSNFHGKLGTEFLLHQLNVTISTSTEAHVKATQSTGLLSLELYNSIRPLDWDNLKTDEKEAALKELRKNLEANEDIKNKKLTVFVVDALKVINTNLLNLSKKEIINVLCPHLHYYYTRTLQLNIAEHFNQPPADGSHNKYSNLVTALKDANNNCKAFRLDENQDFDILSDLVLLIKVGARLANNTTKDFNFITFYSRDKGFRDNFDEFKVYLDDSKSKNDEELQISDALTKIEMSKPY